MLTDRQATEVQIGVSIMMTLCAIKYMMTDTLQLVTGLRTTPVSDRKSL